jgi:choline dehydrogenase-like flavoprotein
MPSGKCKCKKRRSCNPKPNPSINPAVCNKSSTFQWPVGGSGQIWTKDNVPAGELPPPLQGCFTDANIIQVGAGSGGSFSATLLGQTGVLRVLVLDEGSAIDYHTEKFLPGNENEAYFQPDVEKSFFPKFDFVADGEGGYNALGQVKNIAVNVIRGGAMRLSHFAVEAGSSVLHKRDMWDPLGRPHEWDPEYLWGYFMNHAFRFKGPCIAKNHENLGKIWALETKPSPFLNAWLHDAHQVTGERLHCDFNTIDGGVHTIGAEPSNVEPFPPPNNIRSTTEDEYLIPEVQVNPNIIVVRDCKVTRILFENDVETGKPRAIGAEGLFHNRFFRIQFRPIKDRSIEPGNREQIRERFHEVISTLGTVYNPYILMLSGIGPTSVLSQYNIPVIKANDNVGAHLREASTTHMLFTMNASRTDIGFDTEPPWLPSPIIQSRPGMFAPVQVEGKTYEMFLLATPLDFGFSRVIFAISFELEQPIEGNMVITSANYGDDPLVHYGWDQTTLQRHVEVYKLYRNIINNGTDIKTEFAPVVETFPGPQVTSDADLRNAAQQFMQPVNHLSCTTRMALDESDGVVGLDFKVFGVEGLRLGSQSVLRYVPGAGGQFWCMAIAWNLTNKIREELGLPQL